MFPDYFGVMLLALVIIFAVLMVLYMIGWRIIDKITPGILNEELVPPTGSGRQPNVALAIVVAAMVIGVSFVLGCATIAVLTH